MSVLCFVIVPDVLNYCLLLSDRTCVKTRKPNTLAGTTLGAEPVQCSDATPLCLIIAVRLATWLLGGSRELIVLR